MNWTKASALAEILSSLAIVITLIYFTIEIQQNTAALETSSRQATVDNDLEILFAAVDDPDLWEMRYKEELTFSESLRLSAYLFAVTRIQEHNWMQYEAGALDEETWRSYQSGFIGMLSTPQTRTWWEFQSSQADVWTTGFEEMVNSLLENRPIETGTRWDTG